MAAEEEPPDGQVRESTVQKIASLNVAQRMTLAMKGSREERAVLVRDPNKIVAVAVLSSPKMTETEVESIAKMANVSDEILRIIGFSRAWTKNYAVVHALVKNPKSPVAMSMNFLARLSDKDLRNLSTNRNVPDILRVSARKRVVIEK
jgi:predicted component of type VI protein secretion system